MHAWQGLHAAAGLGHSNPRQKIQYHLRLKQELEEMRHECALLLRERFKLEQCVRCAASVWLPKLVSSLAASLLNASATCCPVMISAFSSNLCDNFQ